MIAHEQERFGELVLSERTLASPDPLLAAKALLEGLQSLGLDGLPWTKAAHSLRRRVLAMRRAFPEQQWPDWSDEALLDSLHIWLEPHIRGVTRRAQLDALDLQHILEAMLPAAQKRQLDRMAPVSVSVPSGSLVAIEYGEGEPVLRVKLQEMFGLKTVPQLAEGRIALKLVLLSPAGRPLAVTGDLAGFWINSYPQVRAEMRGRYPKHPWPEDPLSALPTRRAKPR